MSRTLSSFACLLVTLNISACDSGGDGDRNDERDPTPYTARSDVEFIDACRFRKLWP